MTEPTPLQQLIATWRVLAADFESAASTVGSVTAHGWLTRCADQLEAALARSEGAAVPHGWQPMETAPKDEDVFFWVMPKTPEESYVNTSGDPIFSTFAPHLHRGKFQSWSSLDKATHWLPLPLPPDVASPGEMIKITKDSATCTAICPRCGVTMQTVCLGPDCGLGFSARSPEAPEENQDQWRRSWGIP